MSGEKDNGACETKDRELNAADWFRLAHETATEHVDKAMVQVAHWRKALLVTNFLWAAALITLLWFAYFNPVELSTEANQKQHNSTQEQVSSSRQDGSR